MMVYEAGSNSKIEFRLDVFIVIVTESEICHIYKAVILTSSSPQLI
jgi:hypothetical protein